MKRSLGRSLGINDAPRGALFAEEIAAGCLPPHRRQGGAERKVDDAARLYQDKPRGLN